MVIDPERPENKEYIMDNVLNLARRGEGQTNPNPLVGAVIIKDNKVVGLGYHRVYGGPHAEINALKDAEDQAKGGVLFVNLEPCSHYGKTPPCVEAIIKAGIKKVVAAIEDPNPRVSGRGFQRLKEAGIEVETGILEEKALELNEVFIHFIRNRRPFVVMKTAMTLDGKIACATGESRWVTGIKAREMVHRLRNKYQAIMVGVDTVIKDNPRLTTRLIEGGRDPLRVIVDSRGRTPLESKILHLESRACTVIASTQNLPASKEKAYCEKGAEVWKLPRKQGRVDLKALLEKLYQKGVDSVLLEGGATLNWSFIKEELVDRLFIFIAPKIIGGEKAPGPVGGEGLSWMEEALRVRNLKVEKIGRDYVFTGYPDW